MPGLQRKLDVRRGHPPAATRKEESKVRNLQVRAHIYRDRRFNNWESEVVGRWTIEDLRADPDYCHDWISFDCLAWDQEQERLYIGLTAIDTDIFHVFDPCKNTFQALDFKRVSDRFDAKLHRSLEIGNDGYLYLATALLHDMDQQRDARGGKLVRYSPSDHDFEVLAIPVPHHYIQSIVLDRARGILYGFTYPAEFMFRYDLASGTSRVLAYVGNGVMLSQPHNAVLDRAGRVWGTWGESRAFEDLPGPVPIRLFSYDPDTDTFAWYSHGLPKTTPEDPARVDHMLLASDDSIYVGTTAGGFARLDPATGAVEDLGKPFPGPRLAGLAEAPNGCIYGAGNAGYAEDGTGLARLFSYHPDSQNVEDLGPIFDPVRGDGAAKIHMLVSTPDSRLFAGENDNTLRSSYLWEIGLDG